MNDVRTLTIELPEDIARRIEEDVAHGGYASVSAVVREALESTYGLFVISDEVIKREVLPVLEACERDPGRMISSEEVARRLDALHTRVVEARENDI